MVHESRSDLFLVGFFVGFWGGGFEGFYSFLRIYLEVMLFFAIFANGRRNGFYALIILRLLFHKSCLHDDSISGGRRGWMKQNEERMKKELVKWTWQR